MRGKIKKEAPRITVEEYDRDSPRARCWETIVVGQTQLEKQPVTRGSQQPSTS